MNENSPETKHEEDFRVLADFMERFAVPAEGHAREDLTTEEEEQLRLLAAGELDEAGRAKVVPLLARNETAMEFLAQVAA